MSMHENFINVHIMNTDCEMDLLCGTGLEWI